MMQVFDDTACALGEGPLWHPLRGELFWFDITGRKLFARGTDGRRHWDLPEIASAAGWVDRDTLLIGSETGFWRFDIASGSREQLAQVEADNPATRSNDGRADPQGGMWLGTMGKQAEVGAASIWRYYRGEVRLIVPGLTITNAICFSPDGLWAYWTDSRTRLVQRMPLGRDGWPAGVAEPFIDQRGEGRMPDGAVTDAAGNLWIAQWGSGQVTQYDAGGRFLQAVTVPGRQTTCPAWGGAALTTLYVTTARQGLPPEQEGEPQHGRTYAMADAGQGRPEPQVLL